MITFPREVNAISQLRLANSMIGGAEYKRRMEQDQQERKNKKNVDLIYA